MIERAVRKMMCYGGSGTSVAHMRARVVESARRELVRAILPTAVLHVINRDALGWPQSYGCARCTETSEKRPGPQSQVRKQALTQSDNERARVHGTSRTLSPCPSRRAEPEVNTTH